MVDDPDRSLQLIVDDLKCFFIKPNSADNFFNRGRFYGESDDPERFAFFSRAAL